MFLSLAVCSVFIYAEDLVQVKPMKVQAGQGFEEGEMTYEDVVSVNLCNSVSCVGFQFDINVPAGMLVDFDTEGCSRTAFTKKGTKYTWLHTATLSDVKTSSYAGYDRYRCSVSDMTSASAFIGESGQDALNMYFAVPETLADGVYPIYFTDVYLSDENANLVVCGTSTSYMIVGEGKGTLVMEGQIPSFVNAALATETAISTLDLTNVTASNGTFTYVAGRTVKAPTADVKGNVAATVAPVQGNTYASVCLPFAADVDCYTFDAVNDGVASFTAKTTLTANTPALVNKSVTATAENVALAATTTEAQTTGYYVKDDSFCKVNGSATIPALRGWWDIADNVRGFVIDGEETAINAVEGAEAQTIYNVAGMRLNKVQRGVNIVGGKKVVIK